MSSSNSPSRQPLQLLGGLSAAEFMQRYWQRKPLLVRQAIPQFQPPVSPADLFALAARDDVESRLIRAQNHSWSLKQGPFGRRQLPSRQKPQWTLLVQGVDLHDEQAHRLLQQFSFVPQARLDDLMISFATDGGGVGPHFDSYDVFLLQAHGQRRWRIGRQKNLELQEGVPLKILRHFEPEHDWVLEPGDMLYLPPRYAHDGIAVGDCMTYSIGFRAPQRQELAQAILDKLLEALQDEADTDEGGSPAVLYQDAGQQAVSASGAIPAALQEFARKAIAKTLQNRQAIEQALGEYLSEPKPNVFLDDDVPDDSDAHATPAPSSLLRLNRKTRMVYDKRFVYINGESYRYGGKDARAIRKLADTRQLSHKRYQALSPAAQAIIQDWHQQGWLALPW